MRGFDYESISEDVDAAKQTVEDLLFERAIQQLEDSKKGNNLYDDYGNELLPISDSRQGFDFSPYYANMLNNGVQSGILNRVADSTDLSRLIPVSSAKEFSVTIENGAITLSGVNDVNGLAEAITNQLPNALLQALYKN